MALLAKQIFQYSIWCDRADCTAMVGPFDSMEEAIEEAEGEGFTTNRIEPKTIGDEPEIKALCAECKREESAKK